MYYIYITDDGDGLVRVTPDQVYPQPSDASVNRRSMWA